MFFFFTINMETTSTLKGKINNVEELVEKKKAGHSQTQNAEVTRRLPSSGILCLKHSNTNSFKCYFKII